MRTLPKAVAAFTASIPALTAALAVGQFCPIRTRELYLVTAAGYASYFDDGPSGFNSHGWGASAGIGYDFKMSAHFEILPLATYSRGDLGGMNNALTTVTGRHYDVVTIRVGFMYDRGPRTLGACSPFWTRRA